MCEQVTGAEHIIPRDKPLVKWKVLVKGSRGVYYGLFFRSRWMKSKTKRAFVRVSKVDDIGTTQAGFHVFNTKRGAEAYRLIPRRETVCRVEVWGWAIPWKRGKHRGLATQYARLLREDK